MGGIFAAVEAERLGEKKRRRPDHTGGGAPLKK